jgi:hypothetical protein
MSPTKQRNLPSQVHPEATQQQESISSWLLHLYAAAGELADNLRTESPYTWYTGTPSSGSGSYCAELCQIDLLVLLAHLE